MNIPSDLLPKPLAKLAKSKGFTLRPVRAHKVLDWLRQLGIDVTSFPTTAGDKKVYRFYASGPNGKLWNPVHRNGESKIVGYSVTLDYKSGLHEAIVGAIGLID